MWMKEVKKGHQIDHKQYSVKNTKKTPNSPKTLAKTHQTPLQKHQTSLQKPHSPQPKKPTLPPKSRFFFQVSTTSLCRLRCFRAFGASVDLVGLEQCKALRAAGDGLGAESLWTSGGVDARLGGWNGFKRIGSLLKDERTSFFLESFFSF